jgi:ribosomal-protein-alanine N-acetyltransferase
MSVTIRPAGRGDARALLAAHAASREALYPWVEPFRDQAGFDAWLGQAESGRKYAFLAEEDGRLAGVINLNEVVRGIFQSAYLGYYGLVGATGRGIMTAAVGLVVAEAFGALGLHRVEANIQPGNERSRALVQRLGFRLEGFSPRYLRIAGEWRDHERWARLADDPA